MLQLAQRFRRRFMLCLRPFALRLQNRGAQIIFAVGSLGPKIRNHASAIGEAFDLDPLNIRDAYTEYMESVWNNHEKFWELQTDYWQKSMQLWQDTTRKFMGEQTEAIITPPSGDRRFKADEWNESAMFDFIKL